MQPLGERIVDREALVGHDIDPRTGKPFQWISHPVAFRATPPTCEAASQRSRDPAATTPRRQERSRGIEIVEKRYSAVLAALPLLPHARSGLPMTLGRGRHTVRRASESRAARARARAV